MDTITEQRGENHTLILGTCKRRHDEKLRQHDCRGSGTQMEGAVYSQKQSWSHWPIFTRGNRKKPPKPECIQASGLDLITMIGKGEGMDAQFSNLLQTGNTWGALKTTAVGFYFQRDSNLIGMNEVWVSGILKAPQLILTHSEIWEP